MSQDYVNELTRGLGGLIERTQSYIAYGVAMQEFGELRGRLLIELSNLAIDLAQFDAQHQTMDFSKINLRGRIAEIAALGYGLDQQQPGLAPAATAPRQLAPESAPYAPQRPSPPGYHSPNYGPPAHPHPQQQYYQPPVPHDAYQRQDYAMADVLAAAAQEPPAPAAWPRAGR